MPVLTLPSVFLLFLSSKALLCFCGRVLTAKIHIRHLFFCITQRSDHTCLFLQKLCRGIRYALFFMIASFFSSINRFFCFFSLFYSFFVSFFSQMSHKIMEKREMFGCQARRLPTSAQWMCEWTAGHFLADAHKELWAYEPAASTKVRENEGVFARMNAGAYNGKRNCRITKEFDCTKGKSEGERKK